MAFLPEDLEEFCSQPLVTLVPSYAVFRTAWVPAYTRS